MIIQTTFTSVYEKSDRKNRQGSEQTDLVVWQELAWTVARRYCHCLCDSFVFSKQAMIDVSERILGISVTEALRKFDPSKGAKFTTFLYRILKFHAIKE